MKTKILTMLFTGLFVITQSGVASPKAAVGRQCRPFPPTID